MTFDPTVSTGNLITVVAIVGSCLVFATKRSFNIGEFKVQFDNLSKDVAEIKRYINDQHKEELVRIKAEGASSNVFELMRYRMDLQEREMARARANIHRIAQTVQVRLFTLDEVDEDNTPR